MVKIYCIDDNGNLLKKTNEEKKKLKQDVKVS